MTASTEETALLREMTLQIEAMPESALEEFVAHFRIEEYARNGFFARPGDRPTDLGFVVQGLFRAYYVTEDGREVNKTFFPEGTFIMALTAITAQEENRVYLQAMEDSTLLCTPWDGLERCMAKHHSVERFARKTMQWAWVQKEKRETQLIMDDATTRYLAFLQDFPELHNRMPQYQLASYLGISAVQLSRIRAKLAS